MKPWSMEDTCPYRSTPYFGSIVQALCSKEKHLTPLVKLKSQYSLLQVFFKNKFNCNRFEHHIIINWRIKIMRIIPNQKTTVFHIGTRYQLHVVL